jgi:ribosomal-protein-alanine N-acetyltransferase
MTPADLDEIMDLERRCFKDPWTRRMYLSDLTENEMATYLAARWQTLVLAYGGFWLMVDEAHIATIASHPDWRGRGLGQYLLVALIETAQSRGARIVTLEVRAGNLPAQQLYRKLGFEIVGIRAYYYRDGEHGLIMTTPPLAEPAMQTRLAAARVEAAQKLEQCFTSALRSGA